MRLKIYRAATIAEAMARVRSDLGSDSFILGTRRVAEGVEVTAALEPDDDPPAATLPPPPSPDAGLEAALRYHAVPQELAERLLRGALPTTLRATLSFGALPMAGGDPPLLLVGPPGAGKTLTAARLATRLVMGGQMPMMITTDGKRAGATEQLAAFTRLLGLDLTAASHPLALGRALTKRMGGTPVVIDAAGSDPFNASDAEELGAMATASGGIMALVLPAGLDAGEATDLAAAYAQAGARYMVVTRLDLARRIGSALAAAHGARLTLTEAGIAPRAADGLVPLTPDLVVERLLQARNIEHG